MAGLLFAYHRPLHPMCCAPFCRPYCAGLAAIETCPLCGATFKVDLKMAHSNAQQTASFSIIADEWICNGIMMEGTRKGYNQQENKWTECVRHIVQLCSSLSHLQKLIQLMLSLSLFLFQAQDSLTICLYSISLRDLMGSVRATID